VQCGATRQPFLPDVPTATESGLVGFEAASWYAFFAPAKTPKNLVQRFHEAVVAIVGDKKMHDDITNKFRVEVPLLGPQQLAAVIARQLPEWTEVVRENNIKGGA
jgi:tripartite-type tricarboxylate transporter receptor subunit TctC